jgi:putative endonuclease
MKKQETGKRGEQIACKALEKKGYRILERNYRCRHGEIDLIARHHDYIVFIEVRSKTGDAFGSPEESVTEAKKKKIIATALDYLQNHRGLPENWRVDFVAIELDPAGGEPKRVEIMENVVGG